MMMWSVERRNRIRSILLTILAFSISCYCLGAVILNGAEMTRSSANSPTPTVSTATVTPTREITWGFITQASTITPTTTQTWTPSVTFTAFRTPTSTITHTPLPTSTYTITSSPTDTPIPPTDTPVPPTITPDLSTQPNPNETQVQETP